MSISLHFHGRGAYQVSVQVTIEGMADWTAKLDNIAAMLQQVLQKESTIMSAMDDLNKSIDDVATEADTLINLVKNQPNVDPQVEAAAQRLESVVAAMKAVDTSQITPTP